MAGRFLIGTMLLAVVCVFFGMLVARAWDYEHYNNRLDYADSRIEQLEVHDCGLRQFEDLSVSFQPNDRKRFLCAAIMRGEIICTKVVNGGQLYYATCRRP